MKMHGQQKIKFNTLVSCCFLKQYMFWSIRW